ncbi:MarR family winged helix-turn-helix transcriptional regulator [Lysobacter terrae]
MQAPVEYFQFDQLFVAYNRIRRDLDIKLKPLGLTLTSLQILMAIDVLQAHPQQCTRAAIAARVGITNSTASIMIGGLLKRGLVIEAVDGYDLKRKPLGLSMKRTHQDTYYKALAVWDAVLEQWYEALPTGLRRGFFAAIGTARQTIDQQDQDARETHYLKSLKVHKTRGRVLDAKRKATR